MSCCFVSEYFHTKVSLCFSFKATIYIWLKYELVPMAKSGVVVIKNYFFSNCSKEFQRKKVGKNARVREGEGVCVGEREKGHESFKPIENCFFVVRIAKFRAAFSTTNKCKRT